MTRRYPICRQNQGRFYLLGPACRKPDYWAGGDRRKGGVKLIQAFAWNYGKRNTLFVSFTPAVSSKAVKAMRQTTRKRNFRNLTDLSLADIARLYNPVLRGWLQYYGKFCRSAMYPVFRHFNMTLVAWARRKYRRFKWHKIRACMFLDQLATKQPHLFVHWQKGMVGGFA